MSQAQRTDDDVTADLPAAAQRVQAALVAAGSTARVRQTTQTARTAQDAAAACGCPVGAIVKSLVFQATPPGGAGHGLLVLTSGANRVDEPLLGESLGVTLTRADPAFVRSLTGYAIGGIPPLGHAQPIQTVMDADLMPHAMVWAAGGTPDTVFPIAPGELLDLTHARIERVC